MSIENIMVRWAIFAASLLSILFAIFIKGPNLDEFWTVIMADPRLGWDIAWNWWSSDTGHPPGYYALSRMWMEVFPISVTSVRLLNVVFWAALAFRCLLSRETAEIRRFCVIFFLCVTATFFHLERIAEARAYFPAFALVCLLVAELKGLESGAGGKRRITAIFAASIGIALLDYPIFCAAAALLSVAAAALFLASRTKEAAWLLAATTAGGIVLLAGLFNAMSYEHISPPYTSTTIDYARSAMLAIVGGLAGNLVVSALSAKQIMNDRGTRFLRDKKYRQYDFKYMIVVATILVVIEFLVMNLVLRGIITRHLIPVVALVCASVAAWLPEKARSPQIVWLVLAGFVLSTTVVLHRLAGMDNLHRFADLLAAEQRKCSSFKIIPIDMFELGGSTDSVIWQTRVRASRFGQVEMARDFGFSLASPQDRVMDPRCGGAVWFVPAWLDQGATASSVLDHLRVPLDETQRASARMFYQNTVLVVQVPGSAGTASPKRTPAF